jgi:hypothetical protein
MTEETKYSVIFRTGQLYKIDMACTALKDAAIPHFTREENVAGLRLAMPASPSSAPGLSWTLLVPTDHVPRAQETLAAMPFEVTLEHDIREFAASPAVKTGWKLYIGVVLFLTICALVIKIVGGLH